MANHKLSIDQYIPGDFWDPFAVFNQVPNQGNSFPPYNIYKMNGSTYVELAVAGFSLDELDVDFTSGVLTVKGTKTANENSPDIEYIHRGLAYRKFERKFNAFNMKLMDVTLVNGILVAELVPVKESINTWKIRTADKHPALAGINKENVNKFDAAGAPKLNHHKQLVNDETRPW